MNGGISFRPIKKIYNCLRAYHGKNINNLAMVSISKTLKYSFKPCSTISCYEDKDPAPLFFDNKVQDILKRLTGFNLEKIFKNKVLENQDAVEEYKFYTKEDLQEKMEESIKEGKHLLQMPPVIKIRKPIKEVLSYDPAIQNEEETAKIVVTDISYGVSDRDRIIVVREPDGTLRQADWEERDRMNQIYNPRRGRYYKTPPAFQDEYLKETLNTEEYAFILDFACAHFEPDDPLFHKVTREIYEHVTKRSKFEELHSTRHYGPMCFYLAWNKKMDNLLGHYIHQERLQDAVDLVRLYYLLHDEAKVKDLAESPDKSLDFIKKYVEEEAVMKSNLDLAIQAYQEIVREREDLQKNIDALHGRS